MSLRLNVTITGLDAAARVLDRHQEGAAAAGRSIVTVGTNVRYAIYQHEGTRFMTGTFYLQRGLAQVLPEIGPTIAGALPGGAGAVRAAMLRLGFKVEAAAKPLVRVRTGNLRRSLHTTATGR